MDELIEGIEKQAFTTGTNFSYDLDREFKLISSDLNPIQQEHLKTDFNRFFEKGKHVLRNTFHGGILFLKVPEPIEKITIVSRTDMEYFDVSVVFQSELRRPENIKHKTGVGKIESVRWSPQSIFPNFYLYPRNIQKALLLIMGRIVKRICEYGQTNFAYMKIENEFEIELFIDDQIELIQKVEIK